MKPATQQPLFDPAPYVAPADLHEVYPIAEVQRDGFEPKSTREPEPVRVEPSVTPDERAGRRLPLPFVLRSMCPRCGREGSLDLSVTRFLRDDWPLLNRPIAQPMTCEADDAEGRPLCRATWFVRVVVRCTVEAAS